MGGSPEKGRVMYRRFGIIVFLALIAAIGLATGGPTSAATHSVKSAATDQTTVEVSIPFASEGWHIMSVPLEPVNKTILVDPHTGLVDPDSIFHDSHLAGNSPVNRLFRYQPCAGYWAYNPYIITPPNCWFYLGMQCTDCTCLDYPPVGPWWQGLWLLVEVPHTITYTAYVPPPGARVGSLDVTLCPDEWGWMMVGACARVPDPYDPDVSTWPATDMVTDMMWGQSVPPDEPTAWLPTSDCAGPDARDQGAIRLPLLGYATGVGYYMASPPSGQPYCGAPADTHYLTPGEGYWLDVEELDVWLSLLAGQWP
jgi:hypothetical protein